MPSAVQLSPSVSSLLCPLKQILYFRSAAWQPPPPHAPPLHPAPLNQWLHSRQPLIMFSAHFLSLARLHLSLKIHNSSCDHGTSPRIPLSTFGREEEGEGEGAGPLRYDTDMKILRGGKHFDNMGRSHRRGGKDEFPRNTETVEGKKNQGCLFK